MFNHRFTISSGPDHLDGESMNVVAGNTVAAFEEFAEFLRGSKFEDSDSVVVIMNRYPAQPLAGPEEN